MKEFSRSFAAYAMLVASAVIFGALFSVNKLAAIHGVPPIAYTFWQSIGGAILLWVILSLRGERLAFSRQHLVGYVVLGALVMGLPISLLAFVAPKLPASMVTLVLALSPPFTSALSVIFGLERFRFMGLLGLLAGFLGVAVIVAPSATQGAIGSWQWFLLALIAPLMFASANVGAALLRPPAASSIGMSAGVLFGSCVALLPLIFIAHQWWLPTHLDKGLTVTLIAAAINALFLVMLFEVVRLAGPTFFAQFNYLAVAAGVVWGVAIFGEHLSLYFFLAVLLMFLGMFLTVRSH